MALHSLRKDPPPMRCASTGSLRPPLQAKLRVMVEQAPLFETHPSRQAVTVAPASLFCAHPDTATASTGPASTVFAGIGLVSGSMVSRALPFDVMGLLLSAEQARRTLGAKRLLILVADSHALSNGAPPAVLDRKSTEYVERLSAIAERCGFREMTIVRASEWEREARYRHTLKEVVRRLPADTDPYVLRETADIAYVERVYGGVIKVGWALHSCRATSQRDERLFDDVFRRWIGGRACFVYAKAGRALDDRRQKVSPYVVADASRRICLDPREDVAAKLASARQSVSPSTFRGVCNHLKAVTRSYSQLVRPLHGEVSERTQAVIDDLLTPQVAQAASGQGL